MTDLNKKQAFWAEQLPSFKENYICLAQLEAVEFNNETGNFDALTKDATGFDLEDILEAYHSVNTGWAMWLRAKAQAVPVWISTDFMKPDESDLVLGISTTKIAKFNVYQVVALDEFDECEINYWMPLPMAPSESGAEG